MLTGQRLGLRRTWYRRFSLPKERQPKHRRPPMHRVAHPSLQRRFGESTSAMQKDPSSFGHHWGESLIAKYWAISSTSMLPAHVNAVFESTERSIV
jgi:hypothetical protein